MQEFGAGDHLDGAGRRRVGVVAILRLPGHSSLAFVVLLLRIGGLLVRRVRFGLAVLVLELGLRFLVGLTFVCL